MSKPPIGPPERFDVLLREADTIVVRVHPGPFIVLLEQSDGRWKTSHMSTVVRGSPFLPEEAALVFAWVAERITTITAADDDNVTTRCPSCRMVLGLPALYARLQVGRWYCAAGEHAAAFDAPSGTVLALWLGGSRVAKLERSPEAIRTWEQNHKVWECT